LALGALRTLLVRGIRVPEDVAVIGFDDIEDGQYATPSLSTISPDKAQIARLALERLGRQLGDPAEGTGQEDGGPADTRPDDTGPEEIVADHRLVVRESTVGRAARSG